MSLAKLNLKAYDGDDRYAFISYAHADYELVGKYIHYLQVHGARLWFDEGILPSEEWPAEIERKLAGASYCIVFYSKAADASQNVRDEINYARNKGIKLLICYIEETQLTNGMELRIGSIQSIYLSHSGFETNCAKILSGIKSNYCLTDFGFEEEPVIPVTPRSYTKNYVGFVAGIIILLAIIIIAVTFFMLSQKTTPPITEEWNPEIPITQSEGNYEKGEILFDSNDVTVYLNDISFDENNLPVLSIEISNMSDNSVMMTTEDVSVNNVMMEAYFFPTISPGKSKTETISFDNYAYSYKFNSIESVQFKLELLDDQYNRLVISDEITIDFDAETEFIPDTNGEVIFENKDITVIYKEISEDIFNGPVVVLCVENKTDENLSVYIEECSINDKMVDAFFFSSLQPHKIGYEAFYFYEDVSKDSMDEIEFYLEYAVINNNQYYDSGKLGPVIIKP